jgi:hypothetical protein
MTSSSSSCTTVCLVYILFPVSSLPSLLTKALPPRLLTPLCAISALVTMTKRPLLSPCGVPTSQERSATFMFTSCRVNCAFQPNCTMTPSTLNLALKPQLAFMHSALICSAHSRRPGRGEPNTYSVYLITFPTTFGSLQSQPRKILFPPFLPFSRTS